MSNAKDTRSQPSEKPEPQKINPQTGELDAEKLDEVAGGGGSLGGTSLPHGPPPIGP